MRSPAIAKLRMDSKCVLQLIQQIKEAKTRDQPAAKVTLSNTRLRVTNIAFRVAGQSEITPASRMIFSLHVSLYEADDSVIAKDMDLGCSDDDDDNLDVLLGRKKRKNAGDEVDLPAAHSPYFPEVSLPISG